MIEKNIFQSWYTRDLHPFIQEKIDTYKRLNPQYTYHLYTDEDMDRFVNENYKGEIADCYNRLNIIVAKVDFWRYLVLYHYGGVYLDMDSSIEQPLDTLITEEDDAILSAEGCPGLYVQWALIYKKGHPILKRTIDLVVDNIKTNRFPNDIHKMTGPSVYTRAVNETHIELFRTMINHGKIKQHTDNTYRCNDIMYRLYGIDYHSHFTFHHNGTALLYHNKKNWREEQQEKSLLQ
jgi:mannosyltransferase OCH1-like enzyme